MNSMTTSSPRRKQKSPSIALTEDDFRLIDEAFKTFDMDGSGNLIPRELKAALRAFGFEVKKNDVLQILKDHQHPQDEPIDFQTFQNIMKEALTQNPLTRIHRCFDLLDLDGTGKIHLSCLKRVTKDIGLTIEDQELQDMIDEFDTDGDGMIDRADFEKIMLPDSDSD